jgi:hypothetical protein
MKTYGLKIKDFVKASKAATNGDARAMISPSVLTDGRMAMAFDKLAAEDRAGLLLPVELPLMPTWVNCTTEEQAAKNNADIKAAGEAQDAASAHNDAAIARLALLTGLKEGKGSGGCSTLPADSDKIFIGPAACRAFQFTGLVYAPAIGTDSKNKQEICVFEEVEERAAADHSGASYNMSDTNGRAAADYAKELEMRREKAEEARISDSENEPEGPRIMPNSFEHGYYKEENRAPHALRRIGINRKYVEFLGLGGADKVVYMDAERDLSMVFCDGKPEPGAPLSGAVVMPMRGF